MVKRCVLDGGDGEGSNGCVKVSAQVFKGWELLKVGERVFEAAMVVVELGAGAQLQAARCRCDVLPAWCKGRGSVANLLPAGTLSLQFELFLF
ncbi:hypothetical protein V6N12_069326 [Hibiscus sabdariffa]|uniref:Uncharacterized protein n=1 Tax=Hibiscus sabdariffa TaxID=183260 RepID=A0ABR2FDL9_9ROSI